MDPDPVVYVKSGFVFGKMLDPDPDPGCILGSYPGPVFFLRNTVNSLIGLHSSIYRH